MKVIGSTILFAKTKLFKAYAQAAGLRSCNGTPPACFENCFACFRMPALSLGTQPEDVPYARTVERSECFIGVKL